VIEPLFAVTVGFLLQLLDALPLRLPRLVPTFSIPALPDGGKPGGDFIAIQRLLRHAEAVGRALLGVLLD
jgi:hypothetical protein